MTTSRTAVDTLVVLFDHALEETAGEFEYDHWHSLLWNLHNVRPEDWDAVPAGGGRTIRELVVHVGMCYLMYENHGFGDRQRQWGDLGIGGLTPAKDPDSVKTWLRASHGAFRDSLAGLTDDRLDEISQAPWEGPLPIRRIVEIMIQHTFYHCGEINHIRALLQGNDDWDHQDMGREDVMAAAEA
jgi:uncharacterized damage-inducible protein DinB